MRCVHVDKIRIDLKLLTTLLQLTVYDIDAERLLEYADVPHILREGAGHSKVEVGLPSI